MRTLFVVLADLIGEWVLSMEMPVDDGRNGW